MTGRKGRERKRKEKGKSKEKLTGPKLRNCKSSPTKNKSRHLSHPFIEGTFHSLNSLDKPFKSTGTCRLCPNPPVTELDNMKCPVKYNVSH